MQQSKKEALVTMSKWGAERKPFLFIVDFEMEKIQLYPEEALKDANIYFSIGKFAEKKCPDIQNIPFGLESFPIEFESYKKGFDLVLKHILHGDSYLLNLTYPTKIRVEQDLLSMYAASHAKYKLFLDDQFIVFSPETFISVRDDQISSFPMKGTIDASIPDAVTKLKNDPKELAEHHTIVDLIRNDLSIVSKNVRVDKFRYFEKIITNKKELYQTSSEIKGELDKDWQQTIGSLLFSLLPAGSICGAPKQKTIEIIQKAELDARGYYTGVFGYFDGKNLESSVMIRFIEKSGNEYFYRSGGGITFQSDARSEYNELIDKVYVPTI